MVHAGPSPVDPTRTGDRVVVGDWSILFRSEMGDDSRIGFRSLVQGSSFPVETVIDSCEVWIDGEFVREVEWCNVNPSSPAAPDDGGDGNGE